MMLLRTLLLGAVMGHMIMTPCLGDYCADEPNGTYCMVPSLTGYHKCVNNTDTPKNCSKNTRCTCMGLPCKVANPCGSFTLPSLFTGEYTAETNEKIEIVSPAGKSDEHIYRRYWRDPTNKRYREDDTIGPIHDPSFETFIVLPNNQSSLDRYAIIPSELKCVKTVISSLPPSIQVPTYFSRDGNSTIDGKFCQRWVWQTGGHYGAQPINTQIYYIAETAEADFYPVQYFANYPGTQASKTDVTITKGYTVFIPGPPDPEKFDLPGFCEKEIERYPKE